MEMQKPLGGVGAGKGLAQKSERNLELREVLGGSEEERGWESAKESGSREDARV